MEANKGNAYIVYDRVLSYDGLDQTIGGIQSYLKSLAVALTEAGWKAIIIQKGHHEFATEISGVVYKGFPVKGRTLSSIFKQLTENFIASVNQDSDLIIWGSFYNSIPLKDYRTISIQHGISYDRVSDSKLNKFLINLGLGFLIKYGQRRIALTKFLNCKYKVCVDYNFLNWYRTFSLRKDDHEIKVIPNFTEIPDILPSPKTSYKKVLFARRFVKHRGVDIMLEAAGRLLKKYNDISFVFAGEGPLDNKVQALCDLYTDRVSIAKYESNEALAFHKQFDIAVVPTVGSEGTSLSLLEAMASGCAVICSNVGGMTNIIIDRFNGLMIDPTPDQIEQAIEAIYNDHEFGNQLQGAAYSTVANGFSKKLWKQRWLEFIDKTIMHE